MPLDATPTEPIRAVDLTECCHRLGISRRTGERLLTEGKFPIPELPRLGMGQLTRRRWSTYEIELYLREASVRDVQPARRRLRVVRR